MRPRVLVIQVWERPPRPPSGRRPLPDCGAATPSPPPGAGAPAVQAAASPQPQCPPTGPSCSRRPRAPRSSALHVPRPGSPSRSRPTTAEAPAPRTVPTSQGSHVEHLPSWTGGHPPGGSGLSRSEKTAHGTSWCRPRELQLSPTRLTPTLDRGTQLCYKSVFPTIPSSNSIICETSSQNPGKRPLLPKLQVTDGPMRGAQGGV